MRSSRPSPPPFCSDRHALLRLTRLLSISVLTFAPAALVAQASAPAPAAPTAISWEPTDTLPTDTAYTIGTLPNGLRYYIRHNAKPTPHRVEFRLVVRAGSLMETDDQRGVAHFVEHMAFRGTAHFNGNELVDYLQSIGVRFGADVNAQTTFDHTVYEVSLSTDTLARVRKALQILDDWAHGVAFRQPDIADERAIVLGERRSGLGAGRRIQDQQFPVLLKGSRYPDRLPIGTLETITHMTRAQLVHFYTKWYRPDRMAVIAVGDFDKAQMEQWIQTQFSDIPKPAAPLASPVFPIPPQPGTLVSIVRDPEVPVSSVGVIYKGPGYPHGTVAAERAALVRGLFDQMMNQRLTDLLLKPSAPFLHASVGHGPLISPEVGTVQLNGAVRDSGLVRGTEALLVEVARVAEQGFTPKEMERALRSLRAGIDNYDINRNDRPSEALVEMCIANFLMQDPMPSADAEVALDRQLVATIPLAAVDSQAAFWKTTDNRVILVVQPQTASVPPVDTAAVLALWPAVASRTFAAYEDPGQDHGLADSGAGTDSVSAATRRGLMTHLPTPGTVVAERHYPTVGVTQWTLSNGVVVFVKPTDFRLQEVLFAGTKGGGWSVLGDSVYPAALLAEDVANTAKKGRYNQLDLARELTGKILSLSVGITPTSERVSGETRTAEIETLLQLLYLTMTAEGYDSVGVAAFEEEMQASLANRALSPAVIFGDTILVTRAQHSPRSPVVTARLIDAIDPHRALALYNDRLADADGFAFMFVGAVNLGSLRPLVEQYLGSLPALHRHEKVQDQPVFHPPIGIVHKTVVAGKEAKTETVIQFDGPYTSTREHDTDLRILADVLQNRLRNRLREHLGGTYGVGVAYEHYSAPIGTYTVQIQFTADPARRAELITATFAEIDSLRQTGPTAAELEQVTAPRLQSLEQARHTNGYWLSALSLYQDGRSFDELVDDSAVKAMTPARVRVTAQQYLNLQHYEEFDLLPTGS